MTGRGEKNLSPQITGSAKEKNVYKLHQNSGIANFQNNKQKIRQECSYSAQWTKEGRKIISKCNLEKDRKSHLTSINNSEETTLRGPLILSKKSSLGSSIEITSSYTQ